ncbi:hypothetical protein R3P38DRAFT_3266909, partial [Favolaschia claudopus]
MSLLVNGVPASRVARFQGPTTLISASFVQLHSARLSASSMFALTLQTVDYGSFTAISTCEIRQDLDFDVVLATNWAAFVRELFHGPDSVVPPGQDPWAFLPGVIFIDSAGTQPADSENPSSSSSVLLNKSLSESLSVTCTPVTVPGCLRAPVRPVIEPRNYDPMFFVAASSSQLSSACATTPMPCFSDGRDRLNSLLLSLDTSCNIFTQINKDWFTQLLKGHGIPTVNLQSLHEYRQSFLTHIFSG